MKNLPEIWVFGQKILEFSAFSAWVLIFFTLSFWANVQKKLVLKIFIYCIQTLFRWEMADNFPTNFEVPREADTDASGSAGGPAALPPPKLKCSRHHHYLFFTLVSLWQKIIDLSKGYIKDISPGEDTFHSFNQQDNSYSGVPWQRHCENQALWT